MQVETFEVLEVDHAGEVECDDEAVALIEQLGLEGQQKFVRRLEGSSGTKVERTPYRKMTAEEAFVYQTLCPKVTSLATYDDGPIPLRVLQVAAHATVMFTSVEVWSATDSDVKDPVLVGVNGKNSWESGYSRFILARWGDVLEPFSVLLEQAAKRFRARYKAESARIISSAKAGIETIDDVPASECVGKSIPTAYGL